ncbi:hypothetical protein [Novosphingobium sp.]|jgi:hypothetical protein|uniref:hypothetical protein n=1 Tax=Novosphingobium sp. TaxID=1874826 RepID=UPI003D6D4042
MTPIERAARAVVQQQSAPARWEDLAEADQDRLKADIAAALLALREPDDHMEAAGDLALESASCRAIWSAMVDAALADRDEPDATPSPDPLA